MITSYNIVTTSTGGFDASIKVDKYIDGSLISSTNIVYTQVSGSWTDFDGVIRVGYNVVQSLNWTCQITGDIDDHSVGENINWTYNTWKDFTLTQTISSVDKFLIEDGGDYYSIINNIITNLGRTLNAQLFQDYGMDDIPDFDDYDSLPNPSILCWNPNMERSMSATVVGLPYPQTVYSQNIEMLSQTITGVDSVDITSDANTLFAMSFDNGSTWWNYVNNTWVQLTTADAGQTKESVEDIPTNAWNAKVTNRQLMFRFTLLDDTSYVTQIKVNFTN